jgi:tight adherence protein B
MTGWALVALLSAVLAIFLVLFAVFDALLGRTPEQRRIASLKVFTAVGRKPGEPILHQLRAAIGAVIEQSPTLARWAARSEPLLDQKAGAPSPPEWLGVRIGLAFLFALLLTVALPLWAALPAGLLAGYFLPTVVFKAQVQRRKQRFADDLPGMLHLMLSSLKSGFTLQQAVEAAVRDDTGPVAEELSRALSESRISGEFEDALQRIGERLGSTEVTWLVMALRLQREVGGSLSEVMQTTADTMRERAYLRRHVRTLSAEGRFSAYVLIAMPLVTGGVLFATRPEYVRPLYTEVTGIAMLVVAFLLLIVGIVWLRAAVKIEV